MSIKKTVSLLVLTLLMLLPLLSSTALAVDGVGRGTVNFIAGEMRMGAHSLDLDFGNRVIVPTAAATFDAVNADDFYFIINNLTPWEDWQVRMQLSRFWAYNAEDQITSQFYGMLALSDGHCEVVEGLQDRKLPEVLDVNIATQVTNNPQVPVADAQGVKRGSYKFGWDSIALKVSDEQALNVEPYFNYSATMNWFVDRTP